jgi:peptidoglycan/LPS O-acetylase OafA/YrhL
MALIGGFLEGFLVWLLGALAAWLESRRPRHLPAAAALPWLALALFAGLLVAARLGHARDIVLGAGFFIFLMALLWRTPPESRVAHRSPSVARLLALGPFFSRFSYSLYLTHFPVTLLICAALLGHRVPWSTSGLAWFAAVLLVCYFYAYGFYWLFERNTGVLRGWLSRRAGTRAARAPTEPRYEGAQPHPSESVARPGAGSADEGIGALNK